MMTGFEQVLRDIADTEAPITAAIIYSLSHLRGDNLASLRERWPSFPVERRRLIMKRVAETSEMAFDLDFDALCKIGLEDDDDEVRVAAIDGLWDNSEMDFFHKLVGMVLDDPSVSVRAMAATALGRFLYMAEMDEFPAEPAREAQDILLELYRRDDESLEVRRRALEAISNTSREEVAGMIEEAYNSGERLMKVSAVFAMGRSCDRGRWSQIVLHEMGSRDPEIRFEAVRAAGELSIEDAVPLLKELSDSADREIKEAAIWALGEIGGGDVIELLQSLSHAAESSEDYELQEVIEEALQMAMLGNPYYLGDDLLGDFDSF